jgi:2-methylisocitrate lyase-like PEP mutase family enzyme
MNPMTQAQKAAAFQALHVPGDPLLLYNVWDSGSAAAVAAAGAAAIATSSWSVAEAQGFHDGQDLPMELAIQTIARIAATVELPVSADFEGGYSDDDGQLADNIAALLDTGIVGINFEDQVVGGTDLYPTDRQAARIKTIREAADKNGVELFINARTDLFLGKGNNPPDVVDEAIDRAKAYAHAGASSLFIPGLADLGLIERIVKGQSLPVAVMIFGDLPLTPRLAELGVARISWGNAPYVDAMAALTRDARRILTEE